MQGFTSISDVVISVKSELDALPEDATKEKKVVMLYACNGIGKTRLSKLFYDQLEEYALCYNAFTEDLFSWNNDDYILEIDKNAQIFQTIQEQGLDRQIVDNFQKFIEPEFKPVFDISRGQVTFRVHSKEEGNGENIKISRGEESVLIWSVFYTILHAAIDALNDSPEHRTTMDFDKIRYVIIDDPVSSMDDTRIITIALELARLIAKSSDQLKFLITTHHALFFNVLFSAKKKNWAAYILSKSGGEIHLSRQPNSSPFAYHHVIISEIKAAIKNNDLKRYHFNLLRALLEKTANFLGYSGGWQKLLSEEDQGKVFIKTLNHYSHDSLSDLEPKDLPENNKEDFEEAFRFFIKKFKWGIGEQ